METSQESAAALRTPASIQTELPVNEQSIPNRSHVGVFNDPIIGSFLDGNQMQWLDSLLPEGGIPSDFASDLDEQLLLGSW